MKKFFVLLAFIPFLAGCNNADAPVYRNYFKELGHSQKEINQKLNDAFYEVFESERRAYYEVGEDMAYVADVKNKDIRTEGMSYGMMVAVQFGRQDMFDRLWTWCKTYMLQKEGKWKGLYAWHCRYDGTHIDEGSASDGEMYYVTDLLLASRRWGNSSGRYNYLAEAQELLNTLFSKDGSEGVCNIFNMEHKLINFCPDTVSNKWTDPSYHLPAFMEVWAESAQDGREDLYREIAANEREFLHRTCDPVTGINPDQAEFDGRQTVHEFGPFKMISEFHYDSWRVPMNIACDFCWSHKDAEWQKDYADKFQATMAGYGVKEFPDQFSLDGGKPQFIMGAGGYRCLRHSIGLVGTTAVASLMTDTDLSREFVEHLWEMKLEPYEDGYYDVYYDGLEYIFSLLHLSGNFRKSNWVLK